MTAALATTVAMLFVHPLDLPAGSRLWMFLPLAFCVALVYRATRARQPADMPWATLRTFAAMVIGMVSIAAGFYIAHQIVLRYF